MSNFRHPTGGASPFRARPRQDQPQNSSRPSSPDRGERGPRPNSRYESRQESGPGQEPQSERYGSGSAQRSESGYRTDGASRQGPFRPKRRFDDERPSRGDGPPRQDRGSRPSFGVNAEKPKRAKWEFQSEAARSVKMSDFQSRNGENISFEVHPTRGADVTSAKTFGEMTIPESILRNLKELGFQTPTPIQSQAIPIALSNRDLIGIAQTGTGKTGAFLIPILSKLVADSTATALVLVPTRELAEQVFKNAQSMGRGLQIPQALLIGGVAMHGQIRALTAQPRIIIATPGRLMDHLRTRKSLLSKMKFLVLDEADRMVDFGFAPQVLEILSVAPAEHQSLLFSATLPASVQKFVKRLTRNPLLVQMPREELNIPKIDEQSLQIEQGRKNEKLLDCVNATDAKGSVLVFARTQDRTERIHSYLEQYGIVCEKIHGGRSQSQRKRSLERFRKGQARVLIATDVAARGIDVDHITLVVNFDLPQSPEDYVHRIGRTGRAGRTGSALSFVTNEDRRMWSYIQRLMKTQHGGVSRDVTGPTTARDRQGQSQSAAPAGHGAAHVNGGYGGGPNRRERAPFRRPNNRPFNN